MLMVVVWAVLAVVRVVLGVVAPKERRSGTRVDKKKNKKNTNVLKPERTWQRRSPTRRHARIFFSHCVQAIEPGGRQEEPRGARRSQEEPRGARGPGGIEMSQADPG